MGHATSKELNNSRLDTSKGRSYFLVELKARVDELDNVRKVIESMAAKLAEILKQTDTYFIVHKGRLKLREINGSNEVALIYYERADIVRPKTSDVLIIDIEKPVAALIKRMLEKALGIKAVVNKTREVYYHKGTRIHLDMVDGLGTFVEFERDASSKQLESARAELKELLKKLRIDEKNLEKLSYGDLASQGV